MNARRAFTLVEVLVVIALSSILLSMVAVTIHTVFLTDRTIRQRMADDASANRLAKRLRTDAHAAESAQLDADAAGVTLRLPDGTVAVYAAKNKLVERRVLREAEVLHRDSFAFAASEPGWQLDSGELGEVLVLTWTPIVPDNSIAAGVPRQILAAVGLDQQLVAAEQSRSVSAPDN